jgi:hypothetical protein
MTNNLVQSIAVVGLAGHFPGAAEIEAFSAPGAKASPAGQKPGPTDGSGLEGWSAQRRLLVGCAWEAIHQTGSAGRGESDRAGLFVGVPSDAPPPLSANGDGGITEAARELGVGGPAIVVASPLSPALAAVDRACQSLRRAECDLALAGVVSPGGPDRESSEAVAGVLVLKRLASALAEGDRVLAVVRGSVLQPPGPIPGLGHGGESEPRPLRERPALATEYVPPSNPLESAIAGVWQERLGIDRVGVQDSFFELGGNSLLGTQILALLKDWLQQEIPTVSLYEGPTVSALSRVILQGVGGSRRGYEAVRERGERRRRKLQRLAREATQGAAE